MKRFIQEKGILIADKLERGEASFGVDNSIYQFAFVLENWVFNDSVEELDQEMVEFEYETFFLKNSFSKKHS